jgi:hypothetical protein
MLSDYQSAEASAAGETGQLTDPINLARETDYFKGMQVVFTDPDSDNYLHIATVTRSDGPLRTIYFEPPVPTSIPEGDTIDLYNFRGRGSTYNQYNRHINDAITIAREQHALIPHSVEGDTEYNYTTRRLTIPDALTSFAYITFEDYQGRTRNITPRNLRVDRLTREVVLGYSTSGWNGYMPTFVGYAQPSLLADEDDTTGIDPEWLFNEVKAQVLERHLASNMPIGAQDRLYLQERTEAAGKRSMTMARALPNTIRLS